MIVTLQIDKIESSLYRTAVLWGSAEVTESSQYASIEDATAMHEGFAYFADVIYGGASSGTNSLTPLPERASQAADQLAVIEAEMYCVAQS